MNPESNLNAETVFRMIVCLIHKYIDTEGVRRRSGTPFALIWGFKLWEHACENWGLTKIGDPKIDPE